MVEPFWAVPIMVMVLLPTLRFMALLAEPDATVAPFTVTVAVLSAMVGVTVMLLVAYGTLSVSVVGTVCPTDKPAFVLKL